MEYVKKHGKEPEYKMNEQLEQEFDKQAAMLQDEISTKLSLLSGKVFQVKKEDILGFFKSKLTPNFEKYKRKHEYGFIEVSVAVHDLHMYYDEEMNEELGAVGIAGLVVLYTDDYYPTNYAFTELRIVSLEYHHDGHKLYISDVDCWDDNAECLGFTEE